MASWWRKRVTLGKDINLCPVILQARAILAIPDTSKRKSEWRVIAPDNKTALADPDIEPRLFLECEVVGDYWGNGPKTMVIDIEDKKVYRNITGTAHSSDKWETRQYLKSVPDNDIYYKPSEITNYQDVLSRVLDDDVQE
jgi:hypothetical protein